MLFVPENRAEVERTIARAAYDPMETVPRPVLYLLSEKIPEYKTKDSTVFSISDRTAVAAVLQILDGYAADAARRRLNAEFIIRIFQRMMNNCKVGQCIWSDQTLFCEVLDEAGVPNDGKWLMLILYLRGIKDASYLSEVQKSQLQELLVEILRAKEFDDKNYVQANSRIYRIITMKFHEELREIARETSQLAKDMHAIFGKRQSDVANIAEKVDIDLANGVEPASLLAGLRDTLKSVASQMEQDNSMLAVLSKKDGLTGLDNRRSFDAFLSAAVEVWLEKGKDLSLIMFDIDNFKQFNDTYGHLAGDQVLMSLARQLEAILAPVQKSKSRVMAARYGGEEFAVVLSGSAARNAVEIAEKIRTTVERTIMRLRDSENNVLERKLRITVSVGVASAHTGWPGAYQMNLIDFADKSLYQAKRFGRNCTVQYMPDSRQIYARVAPAAK